jgi:hypothetical protein
MIRTLENSQYRSGTRAGFPVRIGAGKVAAQYTLGPRSGWRIIGTWLA